MKKLIPFLIVFLVIFYLLPFVIKSSIILLAVSPLLIIITSLIYGAKFGFNILLALFCAILFIPLLFLKSMTFVVYLIAFFICTILGNLLGLIFRKK